MKQDKYFSNHNTDNCYKSVFIEPKERAQGQGDESLEYRRLSRRTILPLPPTNSDDKRFEMEVYAHFMRHLRNVPNSRIAVKVLSAIQFTADTLDLNDALVAKTLVDMGLRGPRSAFPATFLEFVDKTIQRRLWNMDASTPSTITSLRAHWDDIGEDPFDSVIPFQSALSTETSFV